MGVLAGFSARMGSPLAVHKALHGVLLMCSSPGSGPALSGRPYDYLLQYVMTTFLRLFVRDVASM